MNAKPLLVEVGRRLREVNLEAVLIWPSWRFWREPLNKPVSRKAKLAAAARENERGVRDLIRRWQALPPEQCTNFLRKRAAQRRSVS